MLNHLLSTLGLLFLGFHLNAQTIAEIQGTGGASPYANQTITTTGIVTATESRGYFLQDGVAPRSGIYVFDNSQSPNVGDEVRLSATVVEFYELTELTDVSNFELLSADNPLPAPILLSTAAVADEDYEGMLIRIEDATCTNTDLGFGEWEVDDGSGPVAIDDLIFAFSPQLNTDYNVTGPMTYTFGNYKVLPRSMADIEIALPLYFTTPPLEKDLRTNQLTFTWETNVPASTALAYGLTPSLELGTITGTDNVMAHEIVLDNLQAATVYYVKAISESGMNSAPSLTQVVSTVSNSTGDIRVYFNHEVDHSVATGPLAVSTDAIIDTIISYLDRAQQTLDITMYEVENERIINAIVAAADRGVTVRYLSDNEGNNEVLSTLSDNNIPVLEGNETGLMHDKFILIDRASVNDSWVMTGSMNHTEANLGWDFNNVICIQDQALANAYFLEFNEMWGGSDDQPDLQNAKFSNQKSDNTPHRFLIGGRPTELYFSPTDGTAAQIKRVLDGAQNELAFAVLVFTENSLGSAVLDAYDRGLEVSGIIDYVEFNGSEFVFLQNNDVPVVDYQNADGSQWPDGPTLHHKYAIVDYATPEEAVLITGSHNWTASANSIHDENTLIIRDATLANLYYQEFSARYETLTSVRTPPALRPLRLGPNPVSDQLWLRAPEAGTLIVTDLQGRRVLERQLGTGEHRIATGEWPAGMYHLRLGDSGGKVVKF
ncbi:MAG: phospholipase D-like domain-containing protein [Bacteroidota bacterium]